MAKSNGLSIGRNVKEFRSALGMTTTQLAKKTGVSQAQVSRLENDQQGFRSSTVIRLAKALRVKPWMLFMTSEERAAVKLRCPSIV